MVELITENGVQNLYLNGVKIPKVIETVVSQDITKAEGGIAFCTVTLVVKCIDSVKR